jgi:hypothetical protein
MGEFFSDGALPMGMLFFAIMVLGFVRRKAGNVVARSQYPGLAGRLGLKYVPSTYKTGVGRLEGDFRGFRVSVDPDDQRRIHVRFSGQPAIELHSYVHNKRSRQGQKSFRPTSRVLSQLFKTAHASPSLIETLNADERLAQQLKPVKFIRQLKTLSVSSSGVIAVFDYGNPPYIPAGIVEDLLPRLATLAQVVEPGRLADSASEPSAERRLDSATS